MVDRFIVSKKHLSPKTVGNILTLLISQLNLAYELGWLLQVPSIKKPKSKINSEDYNYLRTKDEIRRFLDSAKIEGEPVFALYFVALQTGMRAGELATLTWSDVDFDRRLIIVQRSFNGVTKGGEVRYVPLFDGLNEYLKEWKLKSGSKWVFSNRDGGMLRESGRIFQEVLHRVLERAGFPEKKVGNRVKRYIRFHDLRHTFASHWMMNSGDKFKLQRILGHKSAEMTDRYSHLDPRSFEADYGRMDVYASCSGEKLIQFKLKK